MRKSSSIMKILITIGIVCVVVLFVWQPWHEDVSLLQQRDPATGTPALAVQMQALTEATKVIRIAGRDVTVTIADTPALQQRGLGGRSSLNADEGMLFVFQKDAPYAFWMKDMQFSIDIVWLSSTGMVVFIAPNVRPSTYPRNFIPSAPARYVLEVPAGFAQTYNVQVGDHIQL